MALSQDGSSEAWSSFQASILMICLSSQNNEPLRTKDISILPRWSRAFIRAVSFLTACDAVCFLPPTNCCISWRTVLCRLFSSIIRIRLAYVANIWSFLPYRVCILVMPLEKARLSKKNPTKATLGIVLDIIPAIANVISIILVTGTMMGSARSKMRFR